jgi:hypothetical protein
MHAAWEARPQGYGICIDFPRSEVVKRWSAEAKGRVRLSRLTKRIQRAAPLFADELLERELSNRPDYFQGL